MRCGGGQTESGETGRKRRDKKTTCVGREIWDELYDKDGMMHSQGSVMGG
jgi:hypothetical protein